MTTNTLQQVQATLEQRGVRDVKFFFVPAMKSMALGDAKEMVANVLKGCLHADKVKFTGVNDRHLVK